MENDYLNKVLGAFEHYYNVKKENVEAPFCAEAEFHSHGEQYFLVKQAKLAEVDSSEYVFFYECNEMNQNLMMELSQTAWERALSRIVPHSNHRNSDVSLIILSKKIEEDSFIQAKKIKYYKSYKFGFWGFSRFKLIAAEISTGRLAYNRLGSDYKKILNNNIFK